MPYIRILDEFLLVVEGIDCPQILVLVDLLLHQFFLWGHTSLFLGIPWL